MPLSGCFKLDGSLGTFLSCTLNGLELCYLYYWSYHMPILQSSALLDLLLFNTSFILVWTCKWSQPVDASVLCKYTCHSYQWPIPPSHKHTHTTLSLKTSEGQWGPKPCCVWIPLTPSKASHQSHTIGLRQKKKKNLFPHMPFQSHPGWLSFSLCLSFLLCLSVCLSVSVLVCVFICSS